MNKTLSKGAMAGVISVALMAGGCATDQYSNTQKGAAIGVLGGALLGAAVSSKSDRNKGMLIGAIGGGLAGAGVGQYMDSQAKDFEKQLASQIQNGSIQIQKNADHSLTVTMTSATAFDTNSSAIKPAFQPTLSTIASIVKRYGKTTLMIEGHTDSSGNDKINIPLSQQRAAAVLGQFQALGVQPERLDSRGFGSSRPRADNGTEAGRQLNRRVEIQIVPVVQ